MRNPLAFFLDALRPGGGLHAAAREGEAKDIAWLLTHDIYKVDCYYDNATAIYEATLCDKPASILTLLQHKANPNLPSINIVSSHKEKPIQNCINQANVSNINLLIMHGANGEDLKFMVKRGDIKDLFFKTLEIKRQYDTYLKEADAQRLNREYQHALVKYQQAGDIWYGLSQNESTAIYQHYYQEKALALYKESINCYEQLSAMEFTSQLKATCQQLFERAADCCYFLHLSDEAKVYSSQAANLYTGLQRKTYHSTLEESTQSLGHKVGLYKRKQRGKDQLEEQQPLLNISYNP